MLIDRALDDGIDTIITCDNGIAAAEEITYGRKQRSYGDRDRPSSSSLL